MPIPMNQGGILSQRQKPGGILSFLQSPEALALASGLLEASQPSFTQQGTFGGGLGKGFQNMLATRDKSMDRALKERQLNIEEAYNKARLAHMASGKEFAPSALGKLIQERNEIAAQDPNSPLLEQYDRVINATGGKKFAPTGLGKLYNELQEVEEGYLPGTNGTVALDPEQQQELRDRYNLQIQKTTTDSGTRKTVLQGQNLLKSIDASNIDALTRYSGPQGAAKLAVEKAKDISGNGSEEYYQYLEAAQAVELEAKEIRQFFGDSITPTVQEALHNMVNATSLTKSPEAAKRMIQKSRDTIRKQVATFEKALKSPAPYSSKPSDASQPSGVSQRSAQDYTDDELWAIVNG